MKVLHTSDLHLGKKLLEESFIEDQKYVLDEIINIIKDNNVEVLLIPGDIYDKSIPSTEAVMLFDDFLNNLSELGITVLITSGNHDSNERLSYGSNLFNKLNVHIVTEYEGSMKKLSIGNTEFYMLPFLKPFHLKHLTDAKEYEKITSANEMFKWIIEKEEIDTSKTNILLMHQFVMNNGKLPEQSDSEIISANSVGTLDAIDANLLDKFDYVALGHIHRPQTIKKNTIRYSGTPLMYSFSEVNDKKGVVLIDTDNIEDIKIIPIEPKRKLRVIRGKFDEVMSMEPSDDLIKVELLEENTILAPMEEIRKRFPNALSLVFIREKVESNENEEAYIEKANQTPLEFFEVFFKEQMEREISSEEKEYLANVLDSLKGDE